MKTVGKMVLTFAALLGIAATASAADKLAVKNSGGTATYFNVTDTGNVGIGVTTPATKLDISDSIPTASLSTAFIEQVYNSGKKRYVMTGAGVPQWYFADSLGNEVGQIRYSTPGGYPGILFYTGATYDQNRFNVGNFGTHFDMYYQTVGQTAAFTITNTGAVGVGTNAPTSKLHVAGDTLRIDTARAGMPTATCNVGEIVWDSTAIWVCTSANSWKKATLQ